jgi:hypothetical protein
LIIIIKRIEEENGGEGRRKLATSTQSKRWEESGMTRRATHTATKEEE